MREPGSGTCSLMQRLVDGVGFAPRIGMEIDSNETIKQAVMAGLGIAFISAHTVALEIEHARLASLDVEGLPVMREWYVVRRRDKHLLPPALALLDFIALEMGRFLPGWVQPAGQGIDPPAAAAFSLASGLTNQRDGR